DQVGCGEQDGLGVDPHHPDVRRHGLWAVPRAAGAGLGVIRRGGPPARPAGRYAALMEAEAARERILAAVRAIGRGRTAGYGEVARRAGLPGRARLVARILAANDDPALPWHRVLRSDGRIAFEAGSAGWIEQAQRLRAEGVEV